MLITVQDKTWLVNTNELGGILKNMHEDGYKSIDLSNIKNIDINEYLMEVLLDININLESLNTHDIVRCYKIAYFLNIEQHMNRFAKDIARRLKISTSNGMKQILSYFDK